MLNDEDDEPVSKPSKTYAPPIAISSVKGTK